MPSSILHLGLPPDPPGHLASSIDRDVRWARLLLVLAGWCRTKLLLVLPRRLPLPFQRHAIQLSRLAPGFRAAVRIELQQPPATATSTAQSRRQRGASFDAWRRPAQTLPPPVLALDCYVEPGGPRWSWTTRGGITAELVWGEQLLGRRRQQWAISLRVVPPGITRLCAVFPRRQRAIHPSGP